MSSTDTSVLLGEQSASKTDAWGSNPHACAAAAAAHCRRGSTENGVRHAVFVLFGGKHAGANPVVGSLRCPDGVADCIGLSEGPGPGSSPGSGSKAGRRPMRQEEGSGRGSWKQFALRVWRMHDGLRSRRARFDSSAGYRINRSRSVPDSHTTLRRSKTRFDSWREHFTRGTVRESGHIDLIRKGS